MNISLKRVPYVLAVSVGSLLLVAPLSYFSVTGSARAIDGWLGTGVFVHGLASTLLSVVAVGVSLLVASIAVDIRFGGFAAMNGRGLRTATDYATCWTVVLAGTTVAIDLAVMMLGYGGRIEAEPIVTVLSSLVLLALTGVAIRVVTSFRAGVHDMTVLER